MGAYGHSRVNGSLSRIDTTWSVTLTRDATYWMMWPEYVFGLGTVTVKLCWVS